MQDSLDMPEIAFQIIHYLLEDDLSNLLIDDERRAQLKLKKRTLCNLARTSKIWSHYANQEIWRDLDSLLPLLRIFSGFRLQFGNENDAYYFVLPMMPEELETVKHYATYVQHISLTSKKASIHHSVYTSLDHAFRGTALFPNLVSLEFDWYTLGAFIGNDYLPMFLSETLDKVTFRVEQSSDTSYLRTIRKRAPRLTTLGIKTGLTGSRVNFYASLALFRNLRKLELALPWVSLANFRAPSNLSELEINGMYRWDEKTATVDMDFSTLTLLTTLKLLGRPDFIKKILPKFSSISLANISLVIKGHGDQESDEKWFSFMRCIPMAWSHTLENFLLQDDSGGPSVRSLTYSDFSLLVPLLQCHCLRSLYFRSHVWNILPIDSDAEKMAEAWPLIETLQIFGEPSSDVTTYYSQRSRASFKGLEYLATGCSLLSSLCIPLKLSLSDVHDNILPISQTRLHHLFTDGVIITDEPSSMSFIANLLVSLFPNCELARKDYKSPELKEFGNLIEYWRSMKSRVDD